MISITRLPEPAKLAENREKWLSAFLEKRKDNPRARPDSRQYGHQEIRNTLQAMSFQKCFYCERRLGEGEDEVDHYIGIAENEKLAFTWSNLYLSCRDCNPKKRYETTIVITACIDPCDISINPSDHLMFDDEFIFNRLGSDKGTKTIQKYQLDRPQLNYLRLRHLQQFERFYRKLQERRANHEGRPLTDREREMIATFKQPEHAFSLMFSVYLDKLDL